MKKHLRSTPARLFLASVAFLSLWWSRSAAMPPSPPPQSRQPRAITDADREQFAQWRKQYAFQSLAERLQYEAPYKNDPTPKLSEDAEKSLKQYGYEVNSGPRAESLRLLHSTTAEDFMSRQGNGLSRLPIPPQPGPAFMKSSGPGQHTLHRNKYLPAEYPDDSGVIPQPLPDFKTYDEQTELARNPLLMPSQQSAFGMHSTAQRAFVDLYDVGYVKSREEVAGFVPHAFTSDLHSQVAPQQVDKDPETGRPKLITRAAWTTTRLELVSLLKHDEPRVYVSKNLPNMAELLEAKTRPLTEFETEGLAVLRDGEEIHALSTPNRIVMLGAVRASKSCQTCHEVPHGSLLGAFSYELRVSRHVIPVPPPNAPKKVADSTK